MNPPSDVSIGSSVPNSGTSILVVDDDGQILELVARFLRSHGFTVHAARDGREMQFVLAESGVDLIVLDLMLPGSNGLDLCRELRKTLGGKASLHFPESVECLVGRAKS